MFNTPSINPGPAVRILKRSALVALIAYLIILTISGYRAYYQVHSLDLQSANSVLGEHSTVNTNVVSYGRTTVDVSVELIQGSHVETLATQHLRGNEWPLFNFIPQRASQNIVITKDVLNRFDSGKARLRATAVGAHQWTRLPPPVVRELEVEIASLSH